MKKFAFISRHGITERQHELAAEQGIRLQAVGDIDAFDDEGVETALKVLQSHNFSGVVCVHPLVALRAKQLGLRVGVFNNVRRSKPGEPPKFETTRLVVVD